MDLPVQDGRHISQKPRVLTRNESSNNLLTQGLETNDMNLLDWCIENTDPPTDISLQHLAHLLSYLNARYWVFSNALYLEWIEVLLKRFYPKIHHVEEFRPVLEDIKGKLKAKTQGIQSLTRLRAGLVVATNMDKSGSFLVTDDAQIVLDED